MRRSLLWIWTGMCCVALVAMLLDWSFLYRTRKGISAQFLLHSLRFEAGSGYCTLLIDENIGADGIELFYSPGDRRSMAFSSGGLSIQYPVLLVWLVVAGALPPYVWWKRRKRRPHASGKVGFPVVRSA